MKIEIDETTLRRALSAYARQITRGAYEQAPNNVGIVSDYDNNDEHNYADNVAYGAFVVPSDKLESVFDSLRRIDDLYDELWIQAHNDYPQVNSSRPDWDPQLLRQVGEWEDFEIYSDDYESAEDYENELLEGLF